MCGKNTIHFFVTQSCSILSGLDDLARPGRSKVVVITKMITSFRLLHSHTFTVQKISSSQLCLRISFSFFNLLFLLLLHFVFVSVCRHKPKASSLTGRVRVPTPKCCNSGNTYRHTESIQSSSSSAINHSCWHSRALVGLVILHPILC